MNGASHILVFLGRLHPALVHLPIGALVVAVMLELLSRSPRFRGVNQHTGLIVTFGAGFAAVSALCGWLLSHEGGYEQDLLGWHKWLGFGTALLCCLAALLYRLDLKKAYRGLLG